MRLDVATTEDALAALWQPWQMLWQQVPDASPFLAPAWLQPWWDAFGTGHPVVATMRAQNRLIALLPLYRLDNKLLPIGVGISDYAGVLLLPAAPSETTRHMLQAALEAGGVDRCDLPELPPSSPLLNTPALEGWTTTIWPGPPCPMLPLMPEPAIPKGMRRDIRQARHRAERAGGWVIETATAATFPALFDKLVHLHNTRWTGRGETGVLADARVLSFHHSAGARLISEKLLRLQAMHLNGRIAAVIYALLSPGRIHFYLSGFDPAQAFESPGTILLSHMIEEAAREGRHDADFLRGDERYKHAWGCIDRPNTGLTFNRA